MYGNDVIIDKEWFEQYRAKVVELLDSSQYISAMTDNYRGIRDSIANTEPTYAYQSSEVPVRGHTIILGFYNESLQNEVLSFHNSEATLALVIKVYKGDICLVALSSLP